MSIYVKNAKVPKCCAECPFETLFSDDIHYCTAKEVPKEIPITYYWECRPPFCPMSEVPEPHGRLIDAEMLMKYCNNTKAKNISNNDIARFPTVIESSGYEWSDLITRQVDEILSIRPSTETDGTWLTEYTEEEAEKEFPNIARYNISSEGRSYMIKSYNNK